MKTFKMKTLSMAILGLVGFALAGNAVAACPTASTVLGTTTSGGGGAWSSQTLSKQIVGGVNTADSSLAITSTGLNGTACKMSVSLLSNGIAGSKALVTDSTPSNEPHYRARFYMDTSGLTGLTLANRSARIFNALATSSPPQTTTDQVVIYLIGGSPIKVRFLIGDTTSPGNIRTINATLPTVANNNFRVEFDLDQASGSFRYWVTDATAVTADSGANGPLSTCSAANTATGTCAIVNTGWSGIKVSNLGLYASSAGFRANVANQVLQLDEFDSRRTTFIGL